MHGGRVLTRCSTAASALRQSGGDWMRSGLVAGPVGGRHQPIDEADATPHHTRGAEGRLQSRIWSPTGLAACATRSAAP